MVAVCSSHQFWQNIQACRKRPFPVCQGSLLVQEEITFNCKWVLFTLPISSKPQSTKSESGGFLCFYVGFTVGSNTTKYAPSVVLLSKYHRNSWIGKNGFMGKKTKILIIWKENLSSMGNKKALQKGVEAWFYTELGDIIDYICVYI